MSRDRTDIFPPHTGPNVLPNSPFFAKLLRHAHRGRTAVYDHALGVKKSYGDVLADALIVRSSLQRKLKPESFERLKRGEELYVGVLAAGGYEFTVAMIAALAIGAAVVPMSVANPPEEATYFVTKSRQIALLSSSSASNLARSTLNLLSAQGNQGLAHIDVVATISHSQRPRLHPSEITISSGRYLNDNAPGVVIFTSGTSGKPKGSVLRRAYIHETAMNLADGYDINPEDVLLHTLPVHHATGLGTSFFPFLNSGACIEFRTVSFDPQWIWNRFKEGGITIFSGVPTIYMRLMWHYQQNLAHLPTREKQQYVDGARSLRSLLCGSSALQEPVQEFWTDLRNGAPILVRYGSSEIPGCIRVGANADFAKLPKGCVGSPTPGVDVKISDEGELLIKSPLMFMKYLYDDEATVAAHDEDGWFRTGDLCRCEDNYYFIIGRASIDIIKSGGYKIGAPEIEKACLNLPYVREAAIVGVDDEEYGQRVGAILTLTDLHCRGLSIDGLRQDLRRSLPAYKLPTLLRVVDGELPKGQTSKVQKKVLGPQLFPSPGWQKEESVQAWDRRPSSATPKL